MASSSATAIQKSATSTTFATARDSIPSARIRLDANERTGPNLNRGCGPRYSPSTSMTHRLDSLALLLLLPLRGE